jgi:hypothetical protein
MITAVAGNEMDVHVKDALPRCPPNVDTDVVAVGLEFLSETVALGYDKFHTGGDFIGRELEKIRAMPKRDN